MAFSILHCSLDSCHFLKDSYIASYMVTSYGKNYKIFLYLIDVVQTMKNKYYINGGNFEKCLPLPP